jgi:hypothetical protein
MKNEITFATDLLTAAINSQDAKTMQTALIFAFGVLFAADKLTPFEEKASNLTDLGVIVTASYFQLLDFAQGIHAALSNLTTD